METSIDLFGYSLRLATQIVVYCDWHFDGLYTCLAQK